MTPNDPSKADEAIPSEESDNVPQRKLVPIDPVFDCAYQGEWDFVLSLLASGAIEPNFRDYTIYGGPTLLDLAFEQNHQLAIFVLRMKYGAHTSFELFHHDMHIFHQTQQQHFHSIHQPPPGYFPQFQLQRLPPQPDIPGQPVQPEQAPPPEKLTPYNGSVQP